MKPHRIFPQTTLAPVQRERSDSITLLGMKNSAGEGKWRAAKGDGAAPPPWLWREKPQSLGRRFRVKDLSFKSVDKVGWRVLRPRKSFQGDVE